MKLKGVEKQFWWNFGQIKDSKDIPTEVSGVSGVDDPECYYVDTGFTRKERIL